MAKPRGMINWENYEGENLLVAEKEGTADCRTIIKLKSEHKFKYINKCFGVEFYLGSYELRNDTIYLELKKEVPFMDKRTYAILKAKKDSRKGMSQP